MNYASLSEIYDSPLLKERENKYNNIIKNLISSNQSENITRKNTSIPTGIQQTNYTNYQEIGAPVGNQRAEYTTYQNVENFSNSLEGDKVLKEIEDKIDLEYNQPKQEYITMKDSEETDCLKFLDHISKCEKCRNFIIKKFKLTPETPEQKNREAMLDIAIYILTGVFVLFLLDSFMSLGKFLNK